MTKTVVLAHQYIDYSSERPAGDSVTSSIWITDYRAPPVSRVSGSHRHRQSQVVMSPADDRLASGGLDRVKAKANSWLLTRLFWWQPTLAALCFHSPWIFGSIGVRAVYIFTFYSWTVISRLGMNLNVVKMKERPSCTGKVTDWVVNGIKNALSVHLCALIIMLYAPRILISVEWKFNLLLIRLHVEKQSKHYFWLIITIMHDFVLFLTAIGINVIIWVFNALIILIHTSTLLDCRC